MAAQKQSDRDTEAEKLPSVPYRPKKECDFWTHIDECRCTTSSSGSGGGGGGGGVLLERVRSHLCPCS